MLFQHTKFDSSAATNLLVINLKKIKIMFTKSNYAKANECLKAINASIKEASKSFQSLKSLLRHLQTKEGWAAGGEAIFNSLQLPLSRKVKAADIEKLFHVEQYTTLKSGEAVLSLFREVVLKEEQEATLPNGEKITVKVPVKDEDGVEKTELRQSPIKLWDVRKFALVVAQARELEDTK